MSDKSPVIRSVDEPPRKPASVKTSSVPEPTDAPKVEKTVTNRDNDPSFAWWVYVLTGGLIVAVISTIIIMGMSYHNERSHQTAASDMVVMQGGSGDIEAVNLVYIVTADRNSDIHYTGVDAGVNSDYPGFKVDPANPTKNVGYSTSVDRGEQSGNWLTGKAQHVDLTYSVTIDTEGEGTTPHCTIKDGKGKVLSEESATGNDTSVTCKYTQHLSW